MILIFNILDYENNKKVQNFLNLTFEFSVIPTINKPTRVTSYTASAIDNIITNSIFDNDFESAIVKTDLSDHFSTIFISSNINEVIKEQFQAFLLFYEEILHTQKYIKCK